MTFIIEVKSSSIRALSAIGKIDYTFTGQRENEATGLIAFPARFYDPKVSRWLSVDPALGEYLGGSLIGLGGMFNPINLNVYHYGGNNPITYIDSDGKSIGSLVKGRLGSVLIYFSIFKSSFVRCRLVQEHFELGGTNETWFSIEGTGPLGISTVEDIKAANQALREANERKKVHFNIDKSEEDDDDDFVDIDDFIDNITENDLDFADEFDDTDILDDDDLMDEKGEKGKYFRGGKKKDRDSWYGLDEKKDFRDFKDWWHREGKKTYGQDIQDKKMAEDVYDLWNGLGKPVAD